MPPWAEAVGRLKTIPGVDQRVAESILAEMGPAMARFPTAGHLASWGGGARATTRGWANLAAAGRPRVTAGCGRR